jgi:hypothetical protein
MRAALSLALLLGLAGCAPAPAPIVPAPPVYHYHKAGRPAAAPPPGREIEPRLDELVRAARKLRDRLDD